MPVAATRRREMKSTTVRLPGPLYEQAQNIAKEERTSLNECIVAALKAYLRAYRRRQIDMEFAKMAEDADFQKEAQLVSEAFEHSDFETLQILDHEMEESVDERTTVTR